MKSRTAHSKRNLIASMAFYSVKTILSFVVRTFFIIFLGINYLGLNSLFTNVLLLLSLAELGIGAAIAYAMYKPIAENDVEKVKSLNALYKKLYMVIGLAVFLLGLLILPFLELFINDTSEIPSDISIQTAFLLFLLQSALSYFFAYKRALIFAAQRNDIESIVSLIVTIIMSIAQILVLILIKNYYIFISIALLALAIDNLIVYLIAKRMFPQINNKNIIPLGKEEKKTLHKNIVAMFFHRIGATTVVITDTVLVSIMIGIAVLGIYSNYLLIITALTTIISMIVRSVRGSIGNLIATSNPNDVYKTFSKLTFLYFWFMGFCTICLLCLIQPFITVWLSTNYLLDIQIIILAIISFYFLNARVLTDTFKECAGLFWNDKWKPLAEVSVNLIVSIILGIYFGLAGIIIGTIASGVLVRWWVEPLILYRNYFKKSVWRYFAITTFYICVTTLVGILTWSICAFIPSSGIWWLLLRAVICISFVNLLFALIYCTLPQFRSLFKSAK